MEKPVKGEIHTLAELFSNCVLQEGKSKGFKDLGKLAGKNCCGVPAHMKSKCH